MNGLRSIHIQHTQHNGNGYFSFIVIFIVLAFILTGCSANWIAGDGRGDWQLRLQNGYSIDRVNGRQKVVIYNDNEDEAGGAIVISKYYVVAYYELDHYIFFQGISTQGEMITDNELQNADSSYYILDSNTGAITGPLNSFQFDQHCMQINVEPISAWIKLKD